MVTYAGSLLKPLAKALMCVNSVLATCSAHPNVFLNGVRVAVLEGRADCEPAQLTVPVSIMLTSRFRLYLQCVALAAPN